MRLAEAYERIRLKSVTSFERSGGLVGHARDGSPEPRRIGSSIHMLVELYLDFADAVRLTPLWERHRIRFLVVCLHADQGRDFRNLLKRIHLVLKQDVDLDAVRFFPEGSDVDRLRGHEWHSWGIFCDHAVKELYSVERSVGPYRLVRSLERGSAIWTARDREGQVVCHLTDNGMRDLVDASPCPITYQPDSKVSPVTYPTWPGFRDRIKLRLTRAFQL